MSEIIKKYSEGKRQYEKELVRALKLKLNKIKGITGSYKSDVGTEFTIDKRDQGNGVNDKYIENKRPSYLNMAGHKRYKGVGCTFYFNRGIVSCKEFLKIGGVVLDDNKLFVCSGPDIKNHYGVCVDENLNAVKSRCLNWKYHPEMTDSCPKSAWNWDSEMDEFSRSSFSWLEVANDQVDRFLPFVKKMNAELEQKRSTLKSSLSEWKSV